MLGRSRVCGKIRSIPCRVWLLLLLLLLLPFDAAFIFHSSLLERFLAFSSAFHTGCYIILPSDLE
jgi:hypothetical protein